MKYLPLRTALSLFVSIVSVICAYGQAADTRPLAPGQSMTREMTGAETHRYTFELKKDEFFQVRVEQKGVDVALRLLDAEGKELAKMDSPNGKNGPETLTWVGSADSKLTLEIGKLDSKSEPGAYSVLREKFRWATEVERKFISAQTNARRLFSAAESLYKTKTPESQKEALAKYREAGSVFREIGDISGEADSFFFSGAILLSLKDSRGAIADFERSLAAYRNLGQKVPMTVILDKMGEILFSLGENDKSIKYLVEALELQRDFTDKRIEAETLSLLSLVYREAGQIDNGIRTADRELLIRMGLGDRVNEVKVLYSIGTLFISKDEPEKAEGYFDRALLLSDQIGDKKLRADTLYHIGSSIFFYPGVVGTLKKGNPQQSLSLLTQARQICKDIGYQTLEALIVKNIGSVYSGMGQHRQALASFQEGLQLDKKNGNKRSEITSLVKIARTYSIFDEWQNVISTYLEALSVARAIRDSKSEIEALQHLGSYYAELGSIQESLKYRFQALDKSRSTGDRELEINCLNVIGLVYLRAGETQQALSFFNKALELVNQSENKFMKAETLERLGSVYSVLKNEQEALNYMNDALALYRANKSVGEASVLAWYGEYYAKKKELQKALEFYHQSLMIYRNKKAVEMETKTLGAIMVVWREAQQPFLASFYGVQAINRIQRRRQSIKLLEPELRKKYLELTEPTYRYLAGLFIEQGSFARAEQVLGMLKEEEYFEFIKRDTGEISGLEGRIGLRESEKALIARYNLLADKVTEIGQEFGKLEDKKRLLTRTNETLSPDEQKRFSELEKQLADANAAFQLFLTKELVNEIGKEKAAVVDVDRSMQGKLKKWGEGTVALYTVAGEDRYRVVLTTAKTQVDGKTEIKIADLNKKVFAFRAALQNPNLDPRPLGKELYDILIKPIEKDLKAANAKTLLWSLDGTLRYIPLAALSPDGQHYLVEDYQNVILTPKTRADVAATDTSWRALGLGVSEGTSIASPEDSTRKIPFSSLPGTERELISIIRNEGAQNETGVLPGRRYINKDFTAENLVNSLSIETDEGKRKFNVVHFASHFHLGTSDSNSFILLGNGRIMTLAEIRNSPSIDFEDVELIALSACNTGFADSANGKEIDSLASVIQTKNGRSVLATLWAVADESTSLVMSEFYRLRKEQPKLSKAAAMQMAQRAMIEGRLKPASPGNDAVKGVEPVSGPGEKPVAPPFARDPARPFAHPYYWSPFVLIGNWR